MCRLLLHKAIPRNQGPMQGRQNRQLARSGSQVVGIPRRFLAIVVSPALMEVRPLIKKIFHWAFIHGHGP